MAVKSAPTTNTNPLAKWRAYFNYTQPETARKLGVSISTVRNWETGVTIPTQYHAGRIKKLTKEAVTYQSLYNWKEAQRDNG